MRKNKGVTLIALVVTIIVLLILAAVSIATLTGENGILSQANKAKVETRGASVDEECSLWKINQEMDNKTTEGTAQTLQELLDSLEERNLITAEEREIINETGEITIGSRTIKFDKEAEGISKIKIGDYVKYSPDTTKISYTLKETQSGYPNQEIPKDTLKWRVLDINEQGNIELISSTPTSTDFYFQGARGYNNGVYLLNDICNELYRNDRIGATARSLNIEDIQNKMKIEADGKKAYEKYGNGTEHEYGKTKTYDGDKKNYPLQWLYDNGIKGESESRELMEAEGEGLNISYGNKSADEELTVTVTFWNIQANEMQNNFINNIYYELLCNNGNLNYWLASRFVGLQESLSNFGLRFCKGGEIAVCSLFYSDGISYRSALSGYLRPVIILPPNCIVTDGEYDEAAGGWSMYHK